MQKAWNECCVCAHFVYTRPIVEIETQNCHNNNSHRKCEQTRSGWSFHHFAFLAGMCSIYFGTLVVVRDIGSFFLWKIDDAILSLHVFYCGLLVFAYRVSQFGNK